MLHDHIQMQKRRKVATAQVSKARCLEVAAKNASILDVSDAHQAVHVERSSKIGTRRYGYAYRENQKQVGRGHLAWINIARPRDDRNGMSINQLDAGELGL